MINKPTTEQLEQILHIVEEATGEKIIRRKNSQSGLRTRMFFTRYALKQRATTIQIAEHLNVARQTIYTYADMYETRKRMLSTQLTDKQIKTKIDECFTD